MYINLLMIYIILKCIIITVNVLKKRDQLQQKIVKVEASMDSSIDRIKKTTISKQEIERMYNEIVSTCEALVGEIKQRQEQERREEEEVKSVKLFYHYLFPNLCRTV